MAARLAAAGAAFAAVRAELRVAQSWQDKADQAWDAAARDRDKAESAGWNLWKAARYGAEALWEGGVAAADEAGLRDVVSVAYHGDDLTGLDELARDWRVTADELADPARGGRF